MSVAEFVHLRVHSDFSMSDGLKKINAILAKVAELKMPALALTDQMNMCGLVKFYQACHTAGIKPIIGADVWLYDAQLPNEVFRLLLLAQNNVGYANITELLSKAYLRGHVQGRAMIDREWLTTHNDGVIVLSGGSAGDLGRALLKGDLTRIKQLVDFYQALFPQRFYLELLRTERPEEENYLHAAVDLAMQTGLPVVATNEVVFLEAQEFDAHEIRICIHDGYVLADERRPKRYSSQQYLRSVAEMQALFADIPEALTNSVEIAKRCNVVVRLGEYFLPNFPTGDLDIKDYLVKVSEQGLAQRLAQLFPEPTERQAHQQAYQKRLQVELDVINKMGFPGYFLIVMEFIQWSKEHNIPVGPGRGSGAGSLVAYALKITDLDPLAFDLLFERFLNPERVSMPDFDIDFCMDRRDEVIEHVADIYGRDAVSQIITFGTMAAKAVIRDVGRVLGHPFGFVDRISKLIPGEPGMTLAKAWDVEPELDKIYRQDEEVRDLIDMARRLEGVTRNAGKHAGGVVISPTKITDFAPLYCDEQGSNPVTQFDKNDVETAGLVKFDFLGLRTLTILQWAVDMVNAKKAQSNQSLINIATIPLDDPASFRLLLRHETTAVFQLESRGMKDLIKRLKPDCFEDMIALVALFRPGPLQSGMVDNFIDRKHGREAISYPDATWQHDSLQPILDPTYGIILYQEQVMQIAQVLAGYTLGGADMLRRAMGKKKPEEMAKQRAGFEQGAVDNGIDAELAMKIFDLVEKFAGYGFNKSHSAAYALVSYQTLWMKTHYPAEFMAAVMSADMDNTDKIVTLADECERMKLPLNPPDVNTGRYKFTVNDQGQVVYGIGAIKGVGEGPVNAILTAREQLGMFTDLFDFCVKVDLKKVGKRVMEKLVLAGALDRLGPHRAALMATLPEAIAAADQHEKALLTGQGDLFGLIADDQNQVVQTFKQVQPWPDRQWLEGERSTLGLYLTGHPINQYKAEIKHYAVVELVDAQPTERDGELTVCGLVIGVRTMINKKGNKWALVTIDDRTARLDIRFFPQDYETYHELLQQDSILLITGQLRPDQFSGGLTMTGRSVIDLDTAREKYVKALQIEIHQSDLPRDFVEQLAMALEPYNEGTCPVKICYCTQGIRVDLSLGLQWRVSPTDELLHKLKPLAKNVQFQFS